MPDLTTIFHHLHRQLFPALTAELGPLSALDQQFCEVISPAVAKGAAMVVRPVRAHGWRTPSLPSMSISSPPPGPCWTRSRPARCCGNSAAGRVPGRFPANRPSVAPSPSLRKISCPSKSMNKGSRRTPVRSWSAPRQISPALRRHAHFQSGFNPNSEVCRRIGGNAGFPTGRPSPVRGV